MRKKILVLIISIFFILSNTQTILAANVPAYEKCDSSSTCPDGYSCQPAKPDPNDPNYTVDLCQPDKFQNIFGKIKTPDAIKNLGGQDASGAKGISQFLSNLIALFYSIAAIVLVFMLIWGAWDWLTSAGEKEKIEAARNKIINAIIGIILFAVAFAIIQVLGHFTGFKFFEGQQP